MNSNQVIDMLKAKLGERTQKELAEQIGISQQFLGDILRGYRDPGKDVLKFLGLEKHCEYVKARTDRRKTA